MQLPTQLKNVLQKSKSSDSCRTIVLFMKEFGYTPKEFMEIPIPTFLIMMEEWNKEIERQNKEMKKTKGRRR